jgi:hypothetical protein
MRAFDVAVLMPPLFDAQSSGEGERWVGFPAIARIVDRGVVHTTSSDIGALDLFAHSVIGRDPYQVVRQLSDRA